MSFSMKSVMLRLFNLMRNKKDYFALTLHPEPVIVTVLACNEEDVIISLPISYIIAFQTRTNEDEEEN